MINVDKAPYFYIFKKVIVGIKGKTYQKIEFKVVILSQIIEWTLD